MEDATIDAPRVSGTPTHLWIVGLVSLLWNAYGGYDYTMTQLREPGYFAMMSEQMHVPVAELQAFFDSFPAWASALWAIGVWGSVAGSILLLMRAQLCLPAHHRRAAGDDRQHDRQGDAGGHPRGDSAAMVVCAATGGGRGADLS